MLGTDALAAALDEDEEEDGNGAGDVDDSDDDDNIERTMIWHCVWEHMHS